MAKWTAGAICAAAALSIAAATAQTVAPQDDRVDRQRSLTGCVVRDAANGGRATIASNGISYMLSGSSDLKVDQYLGKRVEVTGRVDSGANIPRATSGAGVPLSTSRGTTADRTRHFQVKTIQIVSPTCLPQGGIR